MMSTDNAVFDDNDAEIVAALARSGTPFKVKRACVAKLLGRSEKSIKRMVLEKRLPQPRRDGALVYWWDDEVRTFMREMREIDEAIDSDEMLENEPEAA